MKRKLLIKVIVIIGAIVLFGEFLGIPVPGHKTAFLQGVQSVNAAGNNHSLYLPLVLFGQQSNLGIPTSTKTSTPTKTFTPTKTTTHTSSPTRTLSPTPTPTKTSTPTSSPTPTLSPTATIYQTPTQTPTPFAVRSQFEFGLQIESYGTSHLNLARAANANWAGGINIPWKDVEPSLGARNWSVLSYQDQAMRDAASYGLTPFVLIRMTPTWAQKYPGYPCGPMASAYFDEFASFVHDVVARYSVAPYNVKYWEIWNEPDIDHNMDIAPDSPYGCWGESSDPYYGGGYYADMLKVVYPAMKSADSNAKVLVGGLVLDCDPRPGAGCSQTGRGATSPKFLEGILHNGGGAYFDGISIHAYDNWIYPSGYSNPNWQSSSLTTGPVLIEKVKYVRSLLSTYSISGKFLVNTETGMVSWSCTPWPTINAYRETSKSYMIAETLASAIAQGLVGNLWFSMEGSWNCTGLVNPDLTILPSYAAYQFSAGELRDSSWVQDITAYAGVKGYEFDRGDRRIWVLWSLDGNSHTISLPGVPLAVHHVNGASIAPSQSITLGLEPLYFEWNP